MHRIGCLLLLYPHMNLFWLHNHFGQLLHAVAFSFAAASAGADVRTAPPNASTLVMAAVTARLELFIVIPSKFNIIYASQVNELLN